MNLTSIIRQWFAPPGRQRRFEAAAGGRRWEARPHFGRYGPETLAASATIRDRARFAAANNPWAGNGVAALETALIGAGITAAPLHTDAAARKALSAAFAGWTETADADGLTDWFGIQAAIARALIVDGEAFLQLIATSDGLRLRQLPAEMIDAALTRDLSGGAQIVGGIEFDVAGQRVAYHVSPARPAELFGNYAPPIRVPADQILHIMRPLGPGQVRGVSWLAPVLLRLGELDQLEDALLVAAKISAMHAGFLTDQNGSAGDSPFADATQSGDVLESGLEPGTLRFLPAGWDIKFSSPQQAQQSVEFATMQLRAVAAGLGVPEFLLTGDMRGANYSSMRSALVAFRQRVEQMQFHTLIPQLIRPVWRQAIALEVMRGALDFADFEANLADYQAAEFYPPAQPWVDPLKDIQAEKMAIEAGLKSRRQAVAAQGYAIEALDDEIAADRARETSLNLNFLEPANAPDNA